MAVSKSFVAHALDLLALAGPVASRSMFGGHGLYAGGAMFGLLDDDELFLKADGETVAEFVAAGCRQWSYPGPKGPTPGPYWRPPDDAHEDAEAMLPWARLAILAAARAHAAKAARAAAKAARGKAKARPAKAAAAVAKGRPARARPAAAKPPARRPSAKKAAATARPSRRR